MTQNRPWCDPDAVEVSFIISSHQLSIEITLARYEGFNVVFVKDEWHWDDEDEEAKERRRKGNFDSMERLLSREANVALDKVFSANASRWSDEKPPFYFTNYSTPLSEEEEEAWEDLVLVESIDRSLVPLTKKELVKSVYNSEDWRGYKPSHGWPHVYTISGKFTEWCAQVMAGLEQCLADRSWTVGDPTYVRYSPYAAAKILHIKNKILQTASNQ